ncbi:hypothetical protein EMCRGX_G000523 [Ephydatia muelleri]
MRRIFPCTVHIFICGTSRSGFKVWRMDFIKQGLNPPTLSWNRISQTTPLDSAARLCQKDNPFEGICIVNETNYIQLQQHCRKEDCYYLSDIPRLDIQKPCPKGCAQSYAAVAVAKLLDSGCKVEWSNNKLVGVKCTNLVSNTGVKCTDCVVVSGCQMFAAMQLPPWLCSTILLPDVAVYPYSGEIVDHNTMECLRRTTIPFFLAEYYSLTLLCTAKQLAVKLVIQFQLFRRYGYGGRQVSGIVLPYISKKETTKAEDETLKPMMDMLRITEEDGATCSSSNKTSQDCKPVKRNAITKQNIAILVTVEWNCVSLKLDITYTPLKKEDVVETMRRVLTEQVNLHSQLSTLEEKREEKRDKLRSMEEDEAKIDQYLSRTMKMWKVETTTIEQLHSGISFVFRLSCAEEKISLVLKSFSRNSLKNDLSQVETTLRKKKLKQSLGCSLRKSRQNAKACLVPLLDSVKVAIDELHQNDIAHLDIRLPNICFRKDDLDYHNMDKMDIKKLQGENEECVALCKELFAFINDLPETYAPEQWEKFKRMIVVLNVNTWLILEVAVITLDKCFFISFTVVNKQVMDLDNAFKIVSPVGTSFETNLTVSCILRLARTLQLVLLVFESNTCLMWLVFHFPTSICSSLRQLVNILAAGKVPTSVSKFLAGGCLIALNKYKEGCPPDIRPIADKDTEFFQPLQLGVACRAGAEKVAHALRGCIEEHWMDEDFFVLKVDMRNAFNIVSRQAVLDECDTFFAELLPWVSWCYGTHPLLWHPLGQISSEPGVQQGDPLGPLLFALVLQKLVSSLDADEECAEILLQAWYLDDGALAGTRSAVLHALHVIEELGPALGLHVNLAKCEMYSGRATHNSHRRKLLSSLVDVAAVNIQVAVSLLRMCGSFCRMVRIARVTPPSLASDGLRSFDEEVKQCFVMCSAINVTNDAWSQAQLGLKFGVNSALESLIHQKVLSGLIQAQHFHSLLESSSPANRARLLSVAAPHASSWLSVVPSPGLGLHLESNEFQMTIRWWLGFDTSGMGGDVVTRHNRLRDEVFDLCRRAHLSVSVERGHGLTRDLAHTRPADILIAGWDRGKPAALDLTITSPLFSVILGESCYQAGAADPSAKSWAGPASHWQWRLMAIGASRHMIPSPGWHPS